MKSGLIDPKRLGRARDEFAIIFYRWAQADAERQAAQGFPLFALLRDSLAKRYLRVYHALPQGEKNAFLGAMLKRSHERAVQLTGEFLTAEDQRLIECYKRPPWENDRKELEERWNRPRLTAGDRERLRELVNDWVVTETGGNFENWTPTDFVFHRIVLSWKVTTVVSVKSKQNLGYHHFISVASDPEARLKEWISLTGWLGIAESKAGTDGTFSDIFVCRGSTRSCRCS